MNYLGAFILGGTICAIGQLLMDKTSMTPPKVLVLFVVVGNILGFLGIYEHLVEFGGQGATLPLPGFGYALSKGVIESIKEEGLIGIFSGGLGATSIGIGAVLTFSFLASLAFEPRDK